jgi:hypothetical protein
MSGELELSTEDWRRMTRLRDREITTNERFWLEVIRVASRDSDPAPTLKRVQKLRMIFQAGP